MPAIVKKRIFSRRSLENLHRVHPDLVYLMYHSLNKVPFDFAIIDGIRSLEEQKQFVEQGLSTTLNSRHLLRKPRNMRVSFGHAVDIAIWFRQRFRWEPILYYKNAQIIQDISKDLDIPITWGGSWRTFKDAPHFELDWEAYPVEEDTR